MAWISVHQSIDNYKLTSLRKAIGCSKCEAQGILTRIWLWGLDNADKTGEMISVDRSDIAGLLYGDISPGLSPDTVVDCLISGGWIDEINGRLYIHDWDFWQRYWFDFNERKEKDRERKREAKQKKAVGSSFHGKSTEGSEENPAQSATASSTVTASETDQEKAPLPPTGDKQQPVPFEEIKRLYNEICVSFSKIITIDGQRRKAVAARWKTHKPLDTFETLFRKTEASAFMKGNNPRNWTASFDWIMKPSNFVKVLEGTYDNKDKGGQGHENRTTGAPPLSGFKLAGDDNE